jgi:hypothetical protein
MFQPIKVTLTDHDGEEYTAYRPYIRIETPTGTYRLWIPNEGTRLNIMAEAPNSLVVLPQSTNVIQLLGDKPM